MPKAQPPIQHKAPSCTLMPPRHAQDVMTHYFKDFEGNKDLASPFMAWARRMMDLVHCNSLTALEFGPRAQRMCAERTWLEKEVVSIECMVDACVLVKQAPLAGTAIEAAA